MTMPLGLVAQKAASVRVASAVAGAVAANPVTGGAVAVTLVLIGVAAVILACRTSKVIIDNENGSDGTGKWRFELTSHRPALDLKDQAILPSTASA